MFYIIDTQGTTKAVITEPIYQGSVGVNNITVLAPFPANAQISVYATLPNGISLRNLYQLSATTFPQGVPNLKDSNGNIYTAFSGTIHESLTSYSGNVEIWFKVALGVGRELHTYKTSFTVTEGGISDPISIPSDEQYLDRILQYLAELNSDPIKSITYTATGYLAMANSITTNVPYFVDTSENGNIKHIDAEGEFIDVPPSQETTTVAMSFDPPAELGLLQFWMQSPTNGDIVINVDASYNNEKIADKTITITPTSQSVAINPRIFFEGVEANTIVIKINSPENSVLVKGVQVFKSNIYGKYVITQKSGAIAVIDAPDGNSIIKEVEDIKLEIARDKTLIEGYKSDVETIKGEIASDKTLIEGYKSEAGLSASQAAISASQAESNEIQAAESATNAASSAAEAATSAQEANNALQTILGRRTVYYEETLQLALEAITNNTGTFISGDMFIIGALNVPDLVVFAANEQPIATATETITQQQISSNSFNIVVGGRYKLQNSNGVVQWGVVAIESGLSENVVTQTQFTNFVNEVSETYATKEELNNKQDKLEFTTKTFGDINPDLIPTAGAVNDALQLILNEILPDEYATKDELTYVDSNLTQYVDNKTTELANYVDDTYATKEELANKQDKLTFDTIPDEDSANPVESKGIYSAIKTCFENSQSYTNFKVQEALGDISTALTELHNYAETLKGGEA